MSDTKKINILPEKIIILPENLQHSEKNKSFWKNIAHKNV